MAKNDINNPHDKIVKATLSDVALAEKFFDAHLPPSVKKAVNLKTLQLQKGSFVDKELREHMTDLLYSVNISGKTGYLYLLLEHQSSVDDLMAWRLLQYSVKIMAHHLKNNKRQKLPVIYPIVYFTGQSKKGFTTNIIDCFDNPALAKQYFLKPFKVIDLNAISDKVLMKDKTLAGLELLQKHIHARDLTLVLDEMLEKGIFIEMYNQSGEYFHSMLKYIISTGEIKKPETFFGKLIEQFPQEKIMTVAQYYEKKGVKQGIEQGMEKKAETIAKNLLVAGDLTPEKISDASGLPISKVKELMH